VRLPRPASRWPVAPDNASAYVESLETRGRYRATTVPPSHVRDPYTLIALRLGGEPLHPDHGYPARLIAPNRPGVLRPVVARITARPRPWTTVRRGLIAIGALTIAYALVGAPPTRT